MTNFRPIKRNCLQQFGFKLLFVYAVLILGLLDISLNLVYAVEKNVASMGEQQAKAAFLYNLIKYVSWPAGVIQGTQIEVGILGSSGMGEPWKRLNGTSIHSKKIHIRTSNDIGDLNGCHVIYFQNMEQKLVHRSIVAIGNDAVLTVSGLDGFIPYYGGMVSLSVVNGRIIFKVNLKQARGVGLEISSQLLKLATTVYQ